MSADLGAPKSNIEEQEEKASGRGDSIAREGLWAVLTNRRLRDALAMSGNPPRIDARGVAIGLWVALGVPIGAHTLTLIVLRFFIKYNVGLAFAVTWIVNPLTIIPLYSAYYYVGTLVLGEPQAVGIEQFRQVLGSIVHQRHFWESLKAFLTLDLEVLERWAVTAAMVSVVSAAIGYAITYRVQARRIGHSQDEPKPS